MSPRIAAATAGAKRYAAKPCKRCGGTERYTSSGTCCACSDAAVKRRTERIKALMKAASNAG